MTKKAYCISNDYAKYQNPNNLVEMNLDCGKNRFQEGDFVYVCRPEKPGEALGQIRNNPKLDPGEIAVEDYMLWRIFKPYGLLNFNANEVWEIRNKGIQKEKVIIEHTGTISVTLSERKQAGHSSVNQLFVSDEVYGSVMEEIRRIRVKNKRTRGGHIRLRLVNTYTNASIDYKLRDMKRGGLQGNQIVVNFYERELLHLRRPFFIKSAGLDKLIGSLPRSACEEAEILKKSFLCDDSPNRVLSGFIEEKQRSELVKVLRKSGYFNMKLLVIACEKPRGSIFRLMKKAWEKALYVIIGYKRIKLSAIRPLPVDESSRVVRLTSNIMKILGIDENDKVIVSYGNREINMRALSFGQFDAVKNVNLIGSEQDLEYMVGLPAVVRRELSIFDIHSVVSIRRDMNFVFWKKSHMQIIPLLGVLITITQMVDNSGTRAILLILFSCITIYIMLSE